jgi:hypothetical protein
MRANAVGSAVTEASTAATLTPVLQSGVMGRTSSVGTGDAARVPSHLTSRVTHRGRDLHCEGSTTSRGAEASTVVCASARQSRLIDLSGSTVMQADAQQPVRVREHSEADDPVLPG